MRKTIFNRQHGGATIALLASLTLGGCFDSHKSPTAEPDTGLPSLPSGANAADVAKGNAPAASGKAVATITPAKAATTQPMNNNVTGTVTFLQAGDHVTFIADVTGFAPGSEHGFHIHESGNLSDPNLKSAGGHYNPTNQPHGGPMSEHHHAGDLGNLVADQNGHAHLEGSVPGVSLGDKNSILNRSVIIHANADDLKSQPAGDSGSRIAGGMIKLVSEQ